jgi:hypothetical protein
MLPARPLLFRGRNLERIFAALGDDQQRSTLSLAIGYIMQYQGQYEPFSAGAGLREPANGSGQFLPYDLETYHCRPHFVRGKRVKYSSDNGI